MKLSADMASFFLKNGSNKENIFNLIDTNSIDSRQNKVGTYDVFFLILIIVQKSPKVRCLSYQINLANKLIWLEETDTKLVALLGNASI